MNDINEYYMNDLKLSILDLCRYYVYNIDYMFIKLVYYILELDKY